MKKIWMLLTASLLSCTLLGCNTSKDDEKKDVPVNNEATDENTDKTEGNENDANEATNGDEAGLEMSDEAAEKIAELEEATAQPIVTDNNAYGVILQGGNDDEEELEKIEDKIAEQVKAINTNVENVYVSVNPDFVEQITDYGEKINAGEPVEGLFEEFTDVVKRVFPDSS
jgi:YhcN/YlaJ family sporulation lipoprotein